MATIDPIDIGGWHVAYALRYGDINAKIADDIAKGKSTFPKAIDKTTTNALGDTISVKGAVSPWRLTSGGRHTSIVLEVKLSSVRIALAGKNFTGGTVTCTVRALLDSDTNGAVKIAQGQSTDPYDFVYHFNRAPDSSDKTVLNAVLAEWLQTLWPDFGAQLTSIDSSIKADKKEWAWLVPTYSRAIVSEMPGADEADHKLVILSMTELMEGKPTPAPTTEHVAGDVIPDGATIGYVIAPQLVLEKLIKPGLKALFDGAKESDFTTTGSTITTSGELYLNQFKPEANADPVKATFTKFVCKIDGPHIVMSANIAFDYKNISVNSHFECRMVLSLARADVTQADGSVVKDVPHIVSTNALVGMHDIEVTANAALDYASWLVPLGLAFLTAVFGAAQAAKEQAPAVDDEAPAGENNVIRLTELQGVRGDAVPAERIAANAALEAGARAQPRPVVFGCIPLMWAKLAGGALLGFLVGGVIGMIPEFIKMAEEKMAEHIGETLDDWLLNVLKPVDLPGGLATDYTLDSLSVNGALLIGATANPAQKT